MHLWCSGHWSSEVCIGSKCAEKFDKISTFSDFPVIEWQENVIASPMLLETTALNVGKIIGRLQVERAVMHVPVILLVGWDFMHSEKLFIIIWFLGSTGESCNLYTGQCDCKPGFGGRQCNQCEENFWGDPRVQCVPCNCNPTGVDPAKSQCDPQSGKCYCLEGKLEVWENF